MCGESECRKSGRVCGVCVCVCRKRKSGERKVREAGTLRQALIKKNKFIKLERERRDKSKRDRRNKSESVRGDIKGRG